MVDKQEQVRKIKPWRVAAGVLLILIGILLIAYLGGHKNVSSAEVQYCDTKSCFVSEANSCGNALWYAEEEIGSVTYATTECKFMKTVDFVGPDEIPEVQSLIEGKSFICPYEKGKFNVKWIDTLSEGVEYCQGDFKDAIGELLLFSEPSK